MTVRGDTDERRVGGYRLIGMLGEGGMGVVHLAEDREGRRVAMKVLRPHVVGDEEGRDRLAREVASLRRVSSPRVAEVIDADPYGPVPYVVTRYVPGPPLHEQVRRRGPLGESDLRVFALGLAEALADVHAAGVLHRDVKPANVLLADGAPVLIDFGLARVADDVRLTATGWLLGTPGYLAPEVIAGEEIGPASDVHSWASTVVYAGTGRPPAGHGPAAAVMDRVRRGEYDLTGIPASLEPLLAACLDPDPRRRPRLGQVLDALLPSDGFDSDESQPATRPVPAFARDSVGPPPTRVLRTSEDEPGPEQAPAPEPLRRGRHRLGLLGIGLLAAAAVALAPYVAAAVLGATVLLLRFCSVTAQRHRLRRLLRGRARWYDVPASAVSLPAYLARSLVGTVVLLAAAVALVAVTALVELALGVPLPAGAVVVGLVFVAALWWAPGSRRVRRTTRRLTAPLARDSAAGYVAALVGLGAAGVLVSVLVATGQLWAPASHAPWHSGFLHGVVETVG